MYGFIYNIRFFFPCLLLVPVVAFEATETNCEVKHEVSGKVADITCYFPINLNKTRTGFCLNRYGSLRTDTVLSCIWLDENLRCETKEGYDQPKEVSHKLNIFVHGLNSVGFACDTLPADRRIVVNTCFMKQAENSSISTTTGPVFGREDYQSEVQDCQNGSRQIYMAVILTFSFTILAATLLFVLFRHKISEKLQSILNCEQLKNDCAPSASPTRGGGVSAEKATLTLIPMSEGNGVSKLCNDHGQNCENDLLQR